MYLETTFLRCGFFITYHNLNRGTKMKKINNNSSKTSLKLIIKIVINVVLILLIVFVIKTNNLISKDIDPMYEICQSREIFERGNPALYEALGLIGFYGDIEQIFKNKRGFNLEGAGLSSIEGLQCFYNLTKLDLNNNAISDLTPLFNQYNLKTLLLHNNLITDLSPISNLSELNDLDVSFNNIADITVMKKLVKVSQLNLSYNKITDLSPLRNNYVLEKFSVMFNEINDISHLKNIIIKPYNSKLIIEKRRRDTVFNGNCIENTLDNQEIVEQLIETGLSGKYFYGNPIYNEFVKGRYEW